MSSDPRQPTRFVGVFRIVSSTRRWRGKPDECYHITWKTGNRKLREKIGWLSEGYSAAMAHEIRKQRISLARHGDVLPAPRSNVSLRQAWEAYRDEWLAPQGKNTVTDAGLMAHHILPVLGDALLVSLTRRDMERLRAEVLGKGLSPQTAHHVVALVRRIWRKAQAWGMVTGDPPTQGMELPRPDNRRERWLTREEARDLLGAILARSRTWHDIALMSLHTGMRLGEITGLVWAHVDLDRLQVHVRDAKAGSRTALLTETARGMLEERGPGAPGSLVFPGRKGVRSDKASRSFRLAVEACGLNAGREDRRDRVVFHTLRHTYASWLALDGTPLYVIAELLGHSTLEMTRRYAHLCPSAKREAVDGLDKRFHG